MSHADRSEAYNVLQAIYSQQAITVETLETAVRKGATVPKTRR